MRSARQGWRLAGRLGPAILCLALTARPSAQAPLRPFADALAAAPRELIDRPRADPFTYFRFINRAWTARVCEVFADVAQPTMVRLHGDAHVEQFALTKDAGLNDFDDSARGPAFVGIVRFLGSIDLAARQRGWARDRDALWTRFFDGYRRGLANPEYRPSVPDIVHELRRQAQVSRAAHLAWGTTQMQPMDEQTLKAVADGLGGISTNWCDASGVSLRRDTLLSCAPGGFRLAWAAPPPGRSSSARRVQRAIPTMTCSWKPKRSPISRGSPASRIQGRRRAFA